MKPQIVFCSILLLSLCTTLTGQTKYSLSASFGYFSPQGEWKNHMYAEGIDQFQGSYSVYSEFEIKFDEVAVALIYNYSKMSAADWEDFAREEGSDISVSAYQMQIGAILKYYIANSFQHWLYLEAGSVYLTIESNEEFNGYAYEYDFLNPGMSFLGGIGYQFSMNERLSIILPLRILWRPEGISYSAGRSYDILGIYITPGLKLTF